MCIKTRKHWGACIYYALSKYLSFILTETQHWPQERALGVCAAVSRTETAVFLKICVCVQLNVVIKKHQTQCFTFTQVRTGQQREDARW